MQRVVVIRDSAGRIVSFDSQPTSRDYVVVFDGTAKYGRHLFAEEYPRQYPQPQQTVFRFLRVGR